MKTPLTIAIAGNARVGKDTLYKIIKLFYDPGAVRFSLGDILKNDMSSTIFYNFGIDPLNCSDEEKELIRPLMIYWAKIKRNQSKGHYFVDLLKDKLDRDISSTRVITDLRFDEYPYDELPYFQSINAKTIYLDKYIYLDKTSRSGIVRQEKEYVKPCGEEEEKNSFKLKKKCKYYIEWPHLGNDISSIKEFAKPVLDEIFGRL